jgi:acylphosphatase
VVEQIVARKVTVRGHVQGVFFRDSVRREAQRRGVRGLASNRRDGSVEIVLEGRVADVQDVIDYCARGPRGASVTSVNVHARAPQGLSGFEIR